MQIDIELTRESASDCGCCHLSSDTENGPYGCNERSTVLTPREQGVLARIRAAGEKAREIKKDLRQAKLEGRSESVYGAVEELEKLRQMRTELEEERLAAAEERMRFLGHI